MQPQRELSEKARKRMSEGGKASGPAKRRGDSAYYSALGKKAWGVPKKKAVHK